MTETTSLIIGTAGGTAARMLVGVIIATNPIGWGGLSFHLWVP